MNTTHAINRRVGNALFAILAFAAGCDCGVRAKEGNLNYVDPTIGNVAPLLNPNRPVVNLPNQMVRVFPIRYDHLDLQITAFPLSALNVITPQLIFSIKPSVGEVAEAGWNRRLNYDQDFEVNRPWYYSTVLADERIKVEFTAGARTGIYRFTFPDGVSKNLLLSHCYPGGLYDLANGREVYGTENVNDANHQQKGTAYMYGVFSGAPKAGKSRGEKDWGKYSIGTWGGTKTSTMDGEKVWISYAEGDSGVIEFRYAISFISSEQARRNFEELDGMSFEGMEEKGRSAWASVLDRIKVDGGTEAQRRTFYTALYRCYARMVDITEDGKYFSGYDRQIHQDATAFYTDDYTWGNFLALHPLRAILDPDREADMLQSYVRMYTEGGWMPEYPKLYGNRAGMLGFHSVIMFLDAYRKGIRHFDVNQAFAGCLKNAEQATMLPGRTGPKGDIEDFYAAKGYYPAAQGQNRSAVAVTLLRSYDDWALSQWAEELGNSEVAQRYAPRAKDYRNLWNPEAGFLLPKDADGRWISIDPKFPEGSVSQYYAEANGWIYLWNVQHDVEGLVDLMGGKKAFEHRLDQLFLENLGRSKAAFLSKLPDNTGLIGNFAMGNEPSFLIPYLYNYTESPWKAQKMTRLIFDTWFKDDIFGTPGDEDGGAMSAFVVFTAMGFYPVKPGIPMYTITSPVFSKIAIALPNGKTFTVIAHNNSPTNKYIQSAMMNGKALTTPWFSHAELVGGGTLLLEMGSQPGSVWKGA